MYNRIKRILKKLILKNLQVLTHLLELCVSTNLGDPYGIQRAEGTSKRETMLTINADGSKQRDVKDNKSDN